MGIDCDVRSVWWPSELSTLQLKTTEMHCGFTCECVSYLTNVGAGQQDDNCISLTVCTAYNIVPNMQRLKFNYSNLIPLKA